MYTKGKVIKIVIVGKNKRFNKKIRKFFEPNRKFVQGFELMGYNFFIKKITILDLTIRNLIWLLSTVKKFHLLTRSYLGGASACIICTSNKKNTKFFMKITQESHLDTDHILLLKEKNLSIDVFKFISATRLKEYGLIDDRDLKIYREKLPSSVKILSEIIEKSRRKTTNSKIE